MNPVNQNHIPLPRLRQLFQTQLKDVINDANIAQLDIAINAPTANYKLLHHLLISRYAKVTTHHRTEPIEVIGLDIETNYETGEPRLLGYSYPDGHYYADDTPTLQSLYVMLQSLTDNGRGIHLVTWGNLDINCIIRLFNPTQAERERISRGVNGRIEKGEIKAKPPIIRELAMDCSLFIDHYIVGRSLRLGILKGGYSSTIWVFNISQFFPMRIAQAAKGLGLPWKDYSDATHLVNWGSYYDDSDYRRMVLESNKQDAQTVRSLASHLQKIFYGVFHAYPGLLVSTGSLADAAVSKLLDRDAYESNSWRYLRYSVWKDSPVIETRDGVDITIIDKAEAILSEAYSAGYVDQFAIGYFPEVHTADISSAYPHKIRELPDLRHCEMFYGKGTPDTRIRNLVREGYEVFTAAIRGIVYIPDHLKFHPITVRTSQRQNIRPTGVFRASYMYEEREFCEKWGARFKSEEWVIFACKPWKRAAIAEVSEKLADLRDKYRRQMNKAANDSESILYDSMQFMVKVIDNSLYGKTVMTTPVVTQAENGKVEITGLKAGDRYNQLYGSVITARTRVQLAEACMEIETRGGKPILAMTDSLYWSGSRDMLPERLTAKAKTAGLFEQPSTVNEFYLIKTGQYEFRCQGCKDHRKPPFGFHHKMRGLNVPYSVYKNEDGVSDSSFFRDTIKEWVASKPRIFHPEDVAIPIPTRRLVTIGSQDLDNLGKVQDGISTLRPFIMSGKQVEPFMLKWRDAIDGALWLETPKMREVASATGPMEFLSNLHEKRGDYLSRHDRKKMFFLLIFKITGKCRYPAARLSDMSYEALEDWSGVKREWCNL